jgi:hypothetical protein
MQMAARFKPGDRVRVRHTSENFGGCIGTVVKVGIVVCDVTVNGYTGAFLKSDLERI